MEIRGVDFSGGGHPGADIWIAEGRVTGDRLSVSACRSATERFGVSARKPVLRALCDFLEANDGTTGLDFSFGLPAALLPGGVGTWSAAIGWFVETFDADADTMRDRLKERARAQPGDGVELKRQTDAAVGANSPYSFITYYQTLYGIREVLSPLARSDATDVPPMEPAGDRNLIEIYPAGTLKRLDTVTRQYKDDTESARKRRERIVDRLLEPDIGGPALELQPAIRRTIVEEPGGDALDSVIAAVATARAVARRFEPETDFDEREGHIYI